MDSTTYSDKRRISISTWFFVIFSMLSLIVAITSAIYTTKVNIDRDRISSIDNINDDILSLTTILIKNPQLHHLVASPEDYPRVSELVFRSLDNTSKQRIIELLLIEETMAIALINLYERIVVELEYAQEMNYKYRIKFLRNHLANFENDLLLNPRILFLFQNSLEHVSRKVREYYERKANQPGVAAKERDDTGPILRALKLLDPQFVYP